MKKTAIVTGAAGNLGQAVLKQLLNDGFQVIGTILPNESLESFKKGNENFEEYTVDVTDAEAVENFAKAVAKKYGTIDRAALLVGGFAMSDLENTTLTDVQQMLSINFESAFVVAKYTFEQMKKQQEGGKIVLVGAKPALDAEAGKNAIAYSLSKSLIFQLAELLNASGKENGIHTSVIVPSIIDTPPNRGSMPDADFADWVKPEEIAQVISFLFSEKASKLREPVVKIYGNA